MTRKRTNKPFKNFQGYGVYRKSLGAWLQKKKYYTNDNQRSLLNEVSNYKQKYKQTNKYYSDYFNQKKHDPWLDGTFAIDPLTWEVKHFPKT